MAVIIYGTRDYGLVDEHHGELARTTFFHIYFAPLVPVSSTWITHKGPDARGHRIKLHGKSIAAAYLRVWGPIVALGNLGAAFGHGGNAVMHVVLALAAIALCAWSWTWRTLRGDRARRKSDFNYVAFGTRCEPARLDGETRAALKADLDRAWNARERSGSPNDVAHHGAADPAEAVTAYGLLRLAAIERGRSSEEAADAERIIDGDHVPTAAVDGPYRATGAPPTQRDAATATLSDLVAARAAARAEAAPPVELQPEDRKRDARRKRRRYRFGLAVATVAALGGGPLAAMGMRAEKAVTLKELRSIHPPTGRWVHVACDEVVGPLWQETRSSGRIENQIVMCRLDRYYLPVKLDDDAAVPTSVVRGELHAIPEHAVWVKDGLRKEPDLEAATLDVYLDAEGPGRGFQIAVGLALLLAAPVSWILYLRWKRRNRELLAS